MKIVSRLNAATIIYEAAVDTIQELVQKAVFEGADLRGANLSNADLRGADLRSADLTPIRDDFWAVLCGSPKEVYGLRAAIIEGRVDGSTYQGDCACLVGTIANVAHLNYTVLPFVQANSSRPAERFFLGIKKGDKPETNQFSALALAWLETFISNMEAAFGKADSAPRRAKRRKWFIQTKAAVMKRLTL